MNIWAFTGNLGHDASLKHVGDTTVLEFSVAVASGWGDKKATTWVRCAYWGKRGEAVAPFLTKGSQVGVTGEATLREYERKDGTGTGYSMELRVADLTLLGGKPEQPAATGFRREAKPDTPMADDDIPF